jgi:peroxiredoxin
LADFQARLVELEGLGAAVFALSTDSREQATGTVEQLGLTFPVIYGLDGPAIAELLGAYYEQRRNIVQPADFVLNRDRTIAQLSIASGPIGRLTADDAVRYLKFLKEKAEKAAKAK